MDRPIKRAPDRLTSPPPPPPPTHTQVVKVDLLAKGKVKGPVPLTTEELAPAFKQSFLTQVLQVNQPLALEFNGTMLELTLESFQKLVPGGANPSAGQLLGPTDVVFTKDKGAMVALSGAHSGAPRDNIINPDFDFGKLGIGGLGAEFNQIFRRAFASRVFPSHIVKQLGINHVRGMLLYGKRERGGLHIIICDVMPWMRRPRVCLLGRVSGE